MTFHEKLVKLRKMKGLTQDEFASAVGVSRQAVYKWESGQSYPEVTKMIEIKMIFGVSIDDLLDESYEVFLPDKPKKRRGPKPAAEKKAQAEKITREEAAEPVVLPLVNEEMPVETAVPVSAPAEETVAPAPEKKEETVSAPAPEAKEEVREEATVAASVSAGTVTAEPKTATAEKAEETVVTEEKADQKETVKAEAKAEEQAKTEEQPEKKRGFFSRLFGRK